MDVVSYLIFNSFYMKLVANDSLPAVISYSEINREIGLFCNDGNDVILVCSFCLHTHTHNDGFSTCAK